MGIFSFSESSLSEADRVVQSRHLSVSLKKHRGINIAKPYDEDTASRRSPETTEWTAGE